MRQVFQFILGLVLLLPLTACSSGGSSPNNAPIEPSEQPSMSDSIDVDTSDLEKTNKNILVTYFSNTGTTENVANHLSNILNADLYKIPLKHHIPLMT